MRNYSIWNSSLPNSSLPNSYASNSNAPNSHPQVNTRLHRDPLVGNLPHPMGDAPSSEGDLPAMRAPYIGDVNGSFWNAQGLFAAEAGLQNDKKNHALKIARQRDFLGLGETHSSEGKVLVARLPDDFKYFWSHGTHAVAGICLMVSKQFLTNFNAIHEDDWKEVIPGRVGRLSLRGDKGNLDIFVSYLQSGGGAVNRNLRLHSLRALRGAVAPRQEVWTLATGDWNFVVDDRDRLTLSTGQHSLVDDSKEAALCEQLFGEVGLMELEQDAFTHTSGLARSRLDRAYSNHSLAEQLDRTFTSYALEVTPLSSHRPIAFSRRSPKAKGSEEDSIPDWVPRHPSFVKDVGVFFQKLCLGDEGINSGVRRLVLLKGAIHMATEAIKKIGETGGEESKDDELGWTMRFIRAAERVNLKKMNRAAREAPAISKFVNPGDPEARSKQGFWRLKERAVELARESLMKDMEETMKITDLNLKATKKQSILTKLKRLCPGAATTISAMEMQDGSISDKVEDMADALLSHWRRTFSTPCCDGDLLRDWLRSLPDEVINKKDCLPSGVTAWRVRRKDVSRALRLSGNSSPGPDGIPFEVWRQLGDLSVDIFWEITRQMEAEDFEEDLREAYKDEDDLGIHSFNLNLLVCPPKAPTGEDATMGTYYHPRNTRPISIVNADNRIIASSFRWRWEEHFDRFVSGRQQGFIRGRSILKNVAEMDLGMVKAALGGENAAAIFLDFEAAFPSISQEFILASLRHMGLPESAVRSYAALYFQNRCNLRMQGDLFDGFDMTSGVRQGCPLSPLIYVAVVEFFLDLLQHQFPEMLIKAYADDTALLTDNLERDVGQLEELFNNFAIISGLKLNIAKSVVVPLAPDKDAIIKDMLYRTAPTWGGMQLSLSAKYLGFYLGPGRGKLSWEKPMQKFKERINVWQNKGVGLGWSARAYNTFILPVLSYVAQLEELTDGLIDSVDKSILKMAKGPRAWASSKDLLSLKAGFGLNAEFHDLRVTATASKVRVALEDKGMGGKAAVLAKAGEIRRACRNTDCINVLSRWRHWIAGNFIFNLEKACHEVDKKLGEKRKADSEDSDNKKRRSCQGEISRQLLCADLENPMERIRENLKRWELLNPDFHRVIPADSNERLNSVRCNRNLQWVGKHLPPRVGNAVFSTIWNRWTTKRRFQSSGPCLLCGYASGDSIEHYCRCEVVRRVCRQHLRLDPSIFSTLHSFVLVHPCISTKDELTSLALLIYSVYNVTNRIRNGGCPPGSQYDALVQMCREGAMGSELAMSTLRNRWTNPPRERLPPPDLLPWTKSTAKTRAAINSASSRGS